MLELQEQLKLVKAVVNAKPSAPVKFSFNGKEEVCNYADLNETLRKEFNELAGDYYSFDQNKNRIFQLMAEGINDYLPQKVLDQYQQFAEIKRFPQGTKPVFVQKITEASRRRAKGFVTKVGLAGRYETFKLDGRKYEVPTSAYGAAYRIDLEEFLDGRVDFNTLMEIVNEGLDEKIYREIASALLGAVTSIQDTNKHTDTTFTEAEFDKLLTIADSYGQSTIYCTYEFAATMVPAEGWRSDAMKDQKWNNGYLANYKGHNVVVLRQSFEDETNTTKVIDPAYAWMIPTGAEKPVKIAFEGDTLVRSVDNNDDWSRDVQTYTKVGVAANVYNNICVYVNTSLKK